MRRVAGGFVVGGFTDHHVHLQLVDTSLLAESALGRVVDLGGDPRVLASLEGTGVEVAFAGAFLTPADRSVREIADADAAARAVAEMRDAGAVCIKVADNSTAGPVFDDELFAAIVELADAAGLPLVVHAEGQGEAERAARLGADLLAHAPFSERLSDDEIAVQAASVQWISTLAIHGGDAYGIAVDNVRRFHAAGGTVLYGTDMGNGETPVGLNPREIEALRDAGIDGEDLIRVLAPIDRGRELFIPGDAPDPLRARPLMPEDLEA
jgi:imidazolonepropionase-like amidohydrolase